MLEDDALFEHRQLRMLQALFARIWEGADRNGCVSRTDTDGGHVCIDSRKDGLNSGSWDVLSLGVSALSRAQSGASDEKVEGEQLERGPEDAVVAEEWMRTAKWIRTPEALLGNRFFSCVHHTRTGVHAFVATCKQAWIRAA